MDNALLTLNGWYALHDFRTIDWAAWKSLSKNERNQAKDEFLTFYKTWTQEAEEKRGSFGLFSIVGHKADLIFVHMRPKLEELDEVETAFNKTYFAQFTKRSYSYVSVVELSNYVNSPDKDPETDPYIQGRLKPTLPKTKYICFYPMNKRRAGEDNWYMMSMEDRKNLMRSHGMIGRKYAGKVVQVISGSCGLDDWEWGVTLFSDDALHFKNLIYEMRFDEVSARYGDFGSFFVGNRLEEDGLSKYLQV